MISDALASALGMKVASHHQLALRKGQFSLFLYGENKINKIQYVNTNKVVIFLCCFYFDSKP
jgi:hypothetical protein